MGQSYFNLILIISLISQFVLPPLHVYSGVRSQDLGFRVQDSLAPTLRRGSATSPLHTASVQRMRSHAERRNEKKPVSLNRSNQSLLATTPPLTPDSRILTPTSTLYLPVTLKKAEPRTALTFQGRPTLGLAPVTITFTQKATPHYLFDTYHWAYGDGQTTMTTATNHIHRYTQPGWYTVTATAIGPEHQVSATRTSYIHVLGAEFIVSPPLGSPPLVVTLRDSYGGPAEKRIWDFGDGSLPQTTTTLSTSHTYTDLGAYTVTLQVVREGYTYTHRQPNAVLVSGEACEPAPASLPWWDTRYAYRAPLTLTGLTNVTYDSSLTQTIAFNLDTASLITAGQMQGIGADLRLVYWTGNTWQELARHLTEVDSSTTQVTFPIPTDVTTGLNPVNTYLYYGHQTATSPVDLFPTITTRPQITTSQITSTTEPVFFTVQPASGVAPLTSTFTAEISPARVISHTWGVQEYILSKVEGSGVRSQESGKAESHSPIRSFAHSHIFTDHGSYTITLTTWLTGGIVVTTTWPAGVQVIGVDRSEDVTIALGEVEAPTNTAKICGRQATPQTFRAADGRLNVTFPAGSLSEDIWLTYSPTNAGLASDNILASYDLTAVGVNSGLPVTTFDQPLVINLHYDDTTIPEWREATIASSVWDEAAESWAYLLTEIDSTNNYATTQVNHLSTFNTTLMGTLPATILGATNAAEPDLFSGAVSWAYPIYTPPGVNGLQPNLALRYNTYLSGLPENNYQRSGALGAGFSFEPGFIQLDLNEDDLGGYNPDQPCALHLFTNLNLHLTLNGATTRLVQDGDWSPDLTDPTLIARYRLAQDNYTNIELRAGGEAQPNGTRLYLAQGYNTLTVGNPFWRVTTPDGTRYEFGSTPDSTQKLITPFSQACFGESPIIEWLLYPGRAYLSNVRDTTGNQMTYHYEPDETPFPLPDSQPGHTPPVTYDSALRVSRISYGNNTRHLTFDYHLIRADVPTPEQIQQAGSAERYHRFGLTAINVHLGSGNASPALTYRIDYYSDQVNTPFLQQITLSAPETGDLWPSTVLTYHTNIQEAGGGLLKQVDNNYGGQTTFTYNEYAGLPHLYQQDITGGSTPIKQTYTFNHNWREREVEVTTEGVGVTRYQFYDDGPDDPRTGHLKGVSHVDYWDATCYLYHASPTIPGAHFVALAQQSTSHAQRCFTPSGTHYRLDYAYDTYGNLTRRHAWGDYNDETDDRVITVDYEIDEPHWILNRPRQETITTWDADQNAPGHLLAQTDYNYVKQAANRAALAQATVTRHDLVNGVNQATTIHYTPQGNVDWLADSQGARTTFSYDPNSIFPTRVTYPAANGLTLHQTVSYHPLWGTISQQIGVNGAQTDYTYDALGRPVSVVGPAGETYYSYTLKTDGLESLVTAGYSDTTTTHYQRLNGLGQLVETAEMSDKGDIWTAYTYDAAGRLFQQFLPTSQPPSQAWSETHYDALNRVTQVIKPDGSRYTLAYPDLETIHYTDEAGRLTTYHLDPFGQLNEVEQRFNEETSRTHYTYDPFGNLSSIEDANGNLTSLTYDSLSRLLTVSDPDRGILSYAYDTRGNLVRRTDAANNIITYTYDPLNRLTSQTYNNNLAPTIYYTYDQGGLSGYGQRTGMVDLAGATTWTYDLAGRPLNETRAMDGQSYTTAFSYDPLGRLDTLTYPDGERLTYTYDLQGYLTSLNSQLPGEVSQPYLQEARYNIQGQLETLTLGEDALNLTLTYYPDNTPGMPLAALRSFSVTNALTPLLTLKDYTYTPGRSLSTLNGNLGSLSPLPIALTYTYNNLGWLASLTNSASPTVYPNHYLDYDKVGNITWRGNTPVNGSNFNYNQPKPAALPHAPHIYTNTLGIPHTFFYGLTGLRQTHLIGTQENTIAWSYLYNPANQLETVLLEGQPVLTYTYDGDGRRARTQYPDGRLVHYVGDHYQVSLTPLTQTWQSIYESDVSEDGTYLHLLGVTTSLSQTDLYLWDKAPLANEIVIWSHQAQQLISDTISAPTQVRDMILFNDNLYAVVYNLDNPTRRFSTGDFFVQRWADGAWETSYQLPWHQADPGAIENWQVSLTLDPHIQEMVITLHNLFTNGPPDSDGDEGRTFSTSDGFAWRTHNTWTPPYDQPDTSEGATWNVGDRLYQGGFIQQPGSSSWDSYQYQRQLNGDWLGVGATFPQIHPFFDERYTHHPLGGDGGLSWYQRITDTQLFYSPDMGVTLLDSGLSEAYPLVKEIAGQTWLVADGTLYLIQGTTLKPYHEVPGRIYDLTVIDGEVYVVTTGSLDRLQPYQTEVTKHYRLSGQTIASRVSGDLYYHLTDPNGLTTLMTDAQGNEIGIILADPLGMVITNTIPTTLSNQLFAQLDNPNGLQYDGDRFYDPFIGSYLQPEADFGVPLLPQTLHPYGLEVGSLNRVQAEQAFDLISALAPYGVGATSAGLFEKYGLQVLQSAIKAKVAQKLTVGQVRIGLNTLAATRQDEMFNAILKSVGANTSHRLMSNAGAGVYRTRVRIPVVAEDATGIHLKGRALARTLDNFGDITSVSSIVEGTVLTGRNFRVPLSLQSAKSWKTSLSFGLDFVLNAGFQYFADVDNPYLSSNQKVGRAVLSGLGGAGFSVIAVSILTAAGCTATVVCAIGGSIIGGVTWAVGVQPFAFDILGLSENDIKLRPLNLN